MWPCHVKYARICCFVLFVACFAISCFASRNRDDDYVKTVKQNYKKDTNSLLIQQIQSYLTDAYLYTAYASFFGRASVNLPGFEKFFRDRAKALRAQIDYLTQIVNLRGGYIEYRKIELKKRCIELSKELEDISERFPHTCYFVLSDRQAKAKQKHKQKPQKQLKNVLNYISKGDAVTDTEPSALTSMEDALAVERSSYTHLLNLVKTARQQNDPAMRRMLDDELEREMNIVEYFGNLVTRLRQFKDDKELGEYILDSDLVYDASLSNVL